MAPYFGWATSRRLLGVLALSRLLGGRRWSGEIAEPRPAAQGPALDAQQLRAFGADPNLQDTDSDGLDDRFEILHGWPLLRPDRADTDGDGMPDGRERAIGSDPLRADAQATFTSQATHTTRWTRNGPVWAVQLAVRGPGDLAGQARVRPASDVRVPGQVSPSFEVSLARPDVAFERATLTLPYDPTHPDAADPAQLAVVTIDPATGLWEVLPSTADPVKHTVTADTPHFSPFFVAHAGRLQAAL